MPPSQGLDHATTNGFTPAHAVKAPPVDTKAIVAKYQAERAKRLREDGVRQFTTAERLLPGFQDDFLAGSTSAERGGPVDR